MSAKAYTATVRILDEGHVWHNTLLPAVFIVGDDPDERLALGKWLDSPEYDWLGDYCYYELSEPAWFVAKQGQNINLGFMVKTDESIHNITPLTEEEITS